MKHWVIIIHADWNVDYGIENAHFLAGIYNSEEDAEKALESDRIKKFISELNSTKGFYDGECIDTDASVKEFDDSISDIWGLCIGGAAYQE